MFLLADLNIKIVLEMIFIALSNGNIKFSLKNFISKSHTTAKDFANYQLDKNL